MELAAGVMGLLSTAGTAAAGTAATVGLTAAETAAAVASAGAAAAPWAAGTTVSTAAAGASALSSLQGAFTLASAFTSVAGGVMGLGDASLQASAQTMQAEREALEIQREALKKIGDNRAAFAAAGVTLASADPIEASLRDQASQEMKLARLGGRLASGRVRLKGGVGLAAAATDALGALSKGATDIAHRGV